MVQRVDDTQKGTSAVYRAAFPAVRVFIYDHEVTNDIIEVRPNQAGGSAERSPGSCLIVLENRWDKYILTNADMAIIGAKRSDLNGKPAVGVEDLPQSGYDTRYNFSILFLEDREDADDNLKSSEFYSDLLIKKSVIEKKMSFTQKITPKKETNLVQYEPRVIFDYPMQEGDCIFHANDGVRVAMRDPFDPTVWYWQFTGFVDGFTEDRDVHDASIISIMCTDVSKMARYSYAQSASFLDPSISDDLEGNAETGATAVDTGIVLYQQIFEGFTIYDILETVFFGSESALLTIDSAALAEVSNLSLQSDWEIYNYLTGHLNMTVKDSISLMYGADLPNASFYKKEDLDQAKNKYGLKISRSTLAKVVQETLVTGEKRDRLRALSWAEVRHPRGISYKRRDSRRGVRAYFYGDTDQADNQIGDKIPTLYQWNEILHHRVRITDLDTMSVNGVNDLKSSRTIEQVIDIIGKNERGEYPVGHGRVFYLAPAKLASRFGRSVLDRSFGGAPGMHATFKDRLSFIYDLAEYIDFRFYATPKGDLVFEMPFYDFDPYEFFAQKTIWEVGDETARIVKNYKTVFNSDYSGNYINETGVTEIELLDEATNEYDSVFNYDQHFTFERYEQMGFSNSFNDNSIVTYFGARAHTFANLQGNDNPDLHQTQYAKIQELIPTLGQRVLDDEAWGFIDTQEGVDIYTALRLNQINAEARNIGISISPKLGLMVNRPIVWKARNYYANIVSIQHSLVWNSDMSTTVNINQARGWTGEYDPDTLEPVYKHFGGDRPFNLSKFLVKGIATNQRKGGD